MDLQAQRRDRAGGVGRPRLGDRHQEIFAALGLGRVFAQAHVVDGRGGRHADGARRFGPRLHQAERQADIGMIIDKSAIFAGDH